MKKVTLALWLISCMGIACAQKNPVAMKYAGIIDANLAKKHLSIIASDAFEGRETGMPGADKAAHYIADEFKSLGLEPIVKGSYFFNVPIVENTFKVNSFIVNGTPFIMGTNFTATGGMETKTLTVKDIVFIGYGITADNYDDFKGIDITGKIVLYISSANKTVSWSNDRARRIKLIQDKKPALILAVNPLGILNRGSITRTILKKENADGTVPVPVYTLSMAVANELLKNSGKTIDQLKAAIDDNGKPQTQTVKADVSTSYAGEEKLFKADDVLGFLPGSDAALKNEVLVISAHYDHIGLVRTPGATDKVNNGADDDGSGTTGVLSIARAFSQAKKEGNGPRRSVLFLGNVGEEEGLLGSEYYTDHPVIPLANSIADLNIDMIGRVGYEYIGKPDSANYVYVIGSRMLSTDLYKASTNANDTYTKFILNYKYDDPNDQNRFYYRSDHYNFARYNVPIIFYFNGVHDDYHGPGDEVSKINFTLLAKRAQLVFYTAWDLANAEKRPVVDGKNDR